MNSELTKTNENFFCTANKMVAENQEIELRSRFQCDFCRVSLAENLMRGLHKNKHFNTRKHPYKSPIDAILVCGNPPHPPIDVILA
jgi:hypothetical protein